jgi:hypothetical protein
MSVASIAPVAPTVNVRDANPPRGRTLENVLGSGAGVVVADVGDSK